MVPPKSSKSWPSVREKPQNSHPKINLVGDPRKREGGGGGGRGGMCAHQRGKGARDLTYAVVGLQFREGLVEFPQGDLQEVGKRMESENNSR